ncbi:hypothetical protein HH212_18330 [Massilia forsythiae]|uniref:Uncharacterized protein n=1 Tax=Massilia forsythiae TaxID=2728020 RepID=A0A7Z2VZ26_9BURK|nr:hypothetical protein [Massilia forsythiae]QJE01740.1 hypothetical protein HH212_18330 [Massilia forsythiae]
MDKDDYTAPPARAGGVPDGTRPQHGAPLVRPWLDLRRQLVPLIGETGFVALFGRSLRLLAPAHAWLSSDSARKTGALLLDALERDLATVDAAVAGVVNDELMTIFTRQLSALIGPGLTARLLANTVADPRTQTRPGSVLQQNQQEHKE